MADTGSLRRPVVVDTKLAELSEAMYQINTRIATLVDSVHHRLGERPVYLGRKRREWPTKTEEAIGLLTARLAAGAIKSWDVDGVKRILSGIIESRAQYAALEAQTRPLSAEYAEKRWSRFFLVTSSAGGHIHRDRNCSTCHPTTRYGWLPQLSGLTEADAVADQGPLLCSVCFPSAPLAWTTGLEKKVDPKVCPGSGKPARFDERRRAFCSVCGSFTRASANGLAARHNKPAPKA